MFIPLKSSNGAGPGREQNLLIGTSKHLYLTQGGQLRSQQKAIDPRLPGKKQLLTRFVLLDVDTGTLYGEYFGDYLKPDLAGFLARAWAVKSKHPMRGVPKKLNVPKIALSDEEYRSDLHTLKNVAAFEIGQLPSGFSAGTHAIREYDRQVSSLFWRANDPITITAVHALSAILGRDASSGMSAIWEEAWQAVPAPPAVFFDVVDNLYTEIGAWRLGESKLILDGMPESAK